MHQRVHYLRNISQVNKKNTCLENQIRACPQIEINQFIDSKIVKIERFHEIHNFRVKN